MPSNRSIHKPLIIKAKDIIKSKDIRPITGKLLKNVVIIQEYVIYDSSVAPDEHLNLLKGEYQRLVLVNQVHSHNNHMRTVARYTQRDDSLLIKTSERVTKIIGQEHYRTVFTALSSILDQNLKIRSIISMLTEPEKMETLNNEEPKVFRDISCQTNEMRMSNFKFDMKRVRRPIYPYIILDEKSQKPNPNNIVDKKDHKLTETSKNNICESPVLSDNELNNVSVNNLDLNNFCENSSDSATRLSVLSETLTIPGILSDPLSLCSDIDQHTMQYNSDIGQRWFLIPGTDIIVAHKPEDIFHIATKQNLETLHPVQRKRLLQFQFNIDYKNCLVPLDEDGFLPIHLAVIHEDLELVNRQCLMLKLRGASVDEPVSSTGATALQLAIQVDGAPLLSRLVRHGASVLRADAAHRTALHAAAVRGAPVLAALIQAMKDNGRKILYEEQSLWSPEMESQSDEELSSLLLNHACCMFDKQGYTPLMLAAMLGLHENVRLLCDSSRSSVDVKMPTSGNVALYLAIAAACSTSNDHPNDTVAIEKFKKTIEILISQYDGSHIINCLHSHAMTNIHAVLQEYNNHDLTIFITNLIKMKNFKNTGLNIENPFHTILVKDSAGTIECADIKTKTGRRSKIGKNTLNATEGQNQNTSTQKKVIKKIVKVDCKTNNSDNDEKLTADKIVISKGPKFVEDVEEKLLSYQIPSSQIIDVNNFESGVSNQKFCSGTASKPAQAVLRDINMSKAIKRQLSTQNDAPNVIKITKIVHKPKK